MTEKAGALLFAKKLVEDLGAHATEVRVVMGKEPSHFVRLFPQAMVVHAPLEPAAAAAASAAARAYVPPLPWLQPERRSDEPRSRAPSLEHIEAHKRRNHQRRDGQGWSSKLHPKVLDYRTVDELGLAPGDLVLGRKPAQVSAKLQIVEAEYMREEEQVPPRARVAMLAKPPCFTFSCSCACDRGMPGQLASSKTARRCAASSGSSGTSTSRSPCRTRMSRFRST